MHVEVHQTPDGIVYVRTLNGVYADTVAHLQADFGVQLPSLPAGADDRIYRPGIRHTLMGDGNLIAAGPLPWLLGDQLISTIQSGLQAQSTRVNFVSPEQQAIKDAAVIERARVNTFFTQPDRIDLATRFQTATPAQIDAWIDTNVISLAAARAVLKALIKVVLTGYKS